jgi:sulfide:quinone oxidoreductase
MSTLITPTRVIDARGSFCTGPLMELIRGIREAAIGDVFEVGDGKGTLLQFDYDHPPKPPKPNRFWRLGKIVFNKTYWHTVPRGRV